MKMVEYAQKLNKEELGCLLLQCSICQSWALVRKPKGKWYNLEQMPFACSHLCELLLLHKLR